MCMYMDVRLRSLDVTVRQTTHTYIYIYSYQACYVDGYMLYNDGLVVFLRLFLHTVPNLFMYNHPFVMYAVFKHVSAGEISCLYQC